MSATIDKLRIEHRGMAKLLSLLDREVQAFANSEPVDFELVQSIMEYNLQFPDMCHHPKEDVIFQRLCERDAEAAKAVGDLAQERGSKAWLSLDKHMGCGVGACLACVQKIRRPDGSEEWGRVCQDGPIFEAGEIVW